MRHIIKSNIFILLLIALLMTILPIPVQADEVNHGRVDSGGRTGHGSKDWAYTEATGIRIGIYFVEGGAEKFADPTATVYKIGKPTDFAKSVLENVKSNKGYDYTIDIYTDMSVFDYMNKDGDVYNPIDVSETPYTYIKPSDSSIVKSMPDPLNCTTEDWVKWFTGNGLWGQA